MCIRDSFDAVCRVAAQEGYIREEDIARLLAFRDDPSDESWIGGCLLYTSRCV